MTHWTVHVLLGYHTLQLPLPSRLTPSLPLRKGLMSHTPLFVSPLNMAGMASDALVSLVISSMTSDGGALFCVLLWTLTSPFPRVHPSSTRTALVIPVNVHHSSCSVYVLY